MSVKYTVQADVFDIGRTCPQESDCFLVASNVWLWMTYSNAVPGIQVFTANRNVIEAARDQGKLIIR